MAPEEWIKTHRIGMQRDGEPLGRFAPRVTRSCTDPNGAIVGGDCGCSTVRGERDVSDGVARVTETDDIDLIAATLQHTGGNIREAASMLGIDRSTLYEKTKLYGIVEWTRELRKGAAKPPEEAG